MKTVKEIFNEDDKIIFNSEAAQISKYYLLKTDSKTTEEALAKFIRDGYKFPARLRQTVEQYISNGVTGRKRYEALFDAENLDEALQEYNLQEIEHVDF